MQFVAIEFYSSVADPGEQQCCALSIDLDLKRLAQPDAAVPGTNLINHSDLVHIQVINLGLIHVIRQHPKKVASMFSTHDFSPHRTFAAFAAIWDPLAQA
jgi:hypothetical protein